MFFTFAWFLFLMGWEGVAAQSRTEDTAWFAVAGAALSGHAWAGTFVGAWTRPHLIRTRKCAAI